MKTKLTQALKVAIHALETNIVTYNWVNQESCNCGVVAQAILGKPKDYIASKFDAMMKLSGGETVNGKYRHKYRTWKENVQQHCTITGLPTIQILQELANAGMMPEDITHLEYLENPAILKRAELEKTTTYTKKVKTGETKKMVPVTCQVNAGGIKGFFGQTKEETKMVLQVEETFTVETITEKQIPKDHFTQKDNLVKYLKAWVSILEEPQKPIVKHLTKRELQEELLKAVNNEEFEKASTIRYMITVA